MKRLLIKVLKWKLKILAKWTIKKYRPGIIGVTGSVGKTSTKEALFKVLNDGRHVRATSKNFNNEIGLPLTVLSPREEIKGIFFWSKVIFSAFFKIILPKSFTSDYPEILILEYAADRPGDIKYLLEVARPNIGIITAISETPVHVEFYGGPEGVAREKSRLIEHLPATGFAILNHDDQIVMNLKDRTPGHVMSFGFSSGSELKISNYEIRKEKNKPLGISFKLEYGGSVVPIRLKNVFGKAHCYAAAAAACVGIVFRINLVTIVEKLKGYRPLSGRMVLKNGIKDSLILDDCYNASPISMHTALDTLKDLPAKRKIAVLGDMTELGKYTIPAHKEIGEIAAGCVNILFTVGGRAKFIAEGAIAKGFNKKNIHEFDTSEESLNNVQDLIQKEDLVLVKASHSMGFEKIVAGLTKDQLMDD